MTEINKKNDLAVIPPTNNDGDPYVLPLDIFKEGYSAYNISNWFKGRVGDNGTPFAIRWYSHGRLLNILGMRPFIEGQVGDYTIDDSDPDNPQINMAEDASHVHIVGDVDDAQEGGLAIYRLISQAFPKSGIFYGKIGFMGTQDDGTLVNTGVDIVFKVLAGHMNMLGARRFYVTELEKAWLEMQAKIKQYNQEYKDTTDKQAEQFKEDTEKALTDLHTKIMNEVQRAEDTLGDTQASIDANISSLKKLATEIASLQVKIQTEDLITARQYAADSQELKDSINTKLKEVSIPPETFLDSASLQQKYPNGKGGLFITANDGHKWIYTNDHWQDCGIYQSSGIANESIDGSKLTSFDTNTFPVWDTPLIVDFKNSQLIVPKGIHNFNVSGRQLSYHLLSGISPIIYEESKEQAKKDQKSKVNDAKIDLSSIRVKQGGVWVSFDPNATVPESQFKYYSGFSDVPKDEYYIGWIQFGINNFKFIFPAVSDKEMDLVDSTYQSGANLVARNNVPDTDTTLTAVKPWKINFQDQLLILNGYNSVLYKNHILPIEPKTYQLKDITSSPSSSSYKIYLDLSATNKNGNYELKAVSGSGVLPENMPYFGWIDCSARKYLLFNQANNNYQSCHIVAKGRASVDFAKNTVTMPGINYIYNSPSITVVAGQTIDLKYTDGIARKHPGTNTGYFLGLDTSGYIISDDYEPLMDHADIYVGFVDTKNSNYELGNLGNTTDIARFPFLNKKVTCLGDSITRGDHTGTGVVGPSWVEKMQPVIQTSAINAGLNGSRITMIEPNDGSFTQRITNIEDQDLVVMMGGVNDFNRNMPLGSFADSSPKTFYGALKYLAINLYKQNPEAKFLWITPTKLNKDGFQHTYEPDGSYHKNDAGYTELDYVNAVKQVANYYSIPVLDLFNESTINPYIPGQIGNWTADGIHPTEKGYTRLAGIIGRRINNL